jgi:hypothetical protein
VIRNNFIYISIGPMHFDYKYFMSNKALISNCGRKCLGAHARSALRQGVTSSLGMHVRNPTTSWDWVDFSGSSVARPLWLAEKKLTQLAILYLDDLIE